MARQKTTARYISTHHFSLLDNDIPSLRTFWTIFDLEAHCLPLCQGLKSGTLNRAEVHKNISTAIILSYETKTFGFVKPFYRACSHEIALIVDYINGFSPTGNEEVDQEVAGRTAESANNNICSL